MTATSGRRMTILALLVAAFIGQLEGLQWEDNPENGTTLYSCTGRSVTIPWRFTLEEDEYFHDIHWLFQGAFRTELLGSFTHDQFLPSPGYSSRLSYVSPGGLRLRGLRSSDEGNYTVEINGSNGSDFSVSSRRSVYLQVAEGLMVAGGSLKVQQDPVALWDEVKGQWVIRLTCGTFTFVGKPPIRAVWTTPSGEETDSTGYSAGHFNLDLSTRTPVVSGKYGCRVPSELLPSICGKPRREEQGETAPGEGMVAGENGGGLTGEVMVDGVQARLSLLEAEQLQLKSDLKKVQSVNEEAGTKLNRLENGFQGIEQGAEVGFHVRMATDQSYGRGQILKMTQVVTNQGSCYNTASGRFTAPRTGTYVFLFSVASSNSAFNTGAILMVEGRVQARAVAFRGIQHVQMGRSHAVVFLQQGQQAWLNVDYHQRSYWAQGTSFSGFLLPYLHLQQPQP